MILSTATTATTSTTSTTTVATAGGKCASFYQCQHIEVDEKKTL
jgi:hypothetical protein